MRAAVVVGNPRAGSRTLDAATRVAQGLAGADPALVLDLAEIDTELLGWGTPLVKGLVADFAACDLVVVASPTYKAAYTGLLKLFLDKFAGGTGLADVVVAPVMLGGSLAHSLAPELTLKPVLAELGATTALPGLYLLDSTYAESDEIERYVTRWAPVVRVLADHRRSPGAAG
jgi:FMN reductase